MGGILERMGEKTNTWSVFVLFRRVFELYHFEHTSLAGC
jgi:hypothetical protein